MGYKRRKRDDHRKENLTLRRISGRSCRTGNIMAAAKQVALYGSPFPYKFDRTEETHDIRRNHAGGTRGDGRKMLRLPRMRRRVCADRIPGPGSIGDVAARNFAKWREIRLNMDTLTDVKSVDTSVRLFGRTFSLPVFAGPVGCRSFTLRQEIRRRTLQRYSCTFVRRIGDMRVHRGRR